MMDSLFQDVRYAVRSLIRNPSFSLLATLTMAIGVGASAAIFSIVNAVLLRPLPFPHADALVLISQQDRQTKQGAGAAGPANFLDWRERQHSLSGIAALRTTNMTMASADHPERITGATVTANFFDVLELKPALGRAFLPQEEGPGAARVAVLSDGLWRRRFGGSPDVLGLTARFNDEPRTIVGVMPPDFDYPDKAVVWIPGHWRVPDDPLSPAQDPTPQRGHTYFTALARIRPGMTLAGARADMDAVAASLERDYPDDDRNVGVVLTPLHDDLVADVRPMLLLLFAAVGLLLLIATANVSGLLMARASARHQEIAIRIALGATRARILAQLLTESVLLALCGGTGGMLIAMWLVGPLVSLSPVDLKGVTVDPRVLLFGLAVSTLAGLVFGLAPAHQLSRVDVHDDLKQSARGASGARQRRIRAGLVAAEVTLSLVLLVAAGLTIRSFFKLQQEPPGFNPDHVLTLGVVLPPARYPTPAQRADFWQNSIESLRQVPGVSLAGATSRLPLLPGNSLRGLTIPGRAPDKPAAADYRTASPEYFRAMGIPVLRGRTFEEGDRESRPLVAVVSATAAQRFWPDRSPIGSHFSINEPDITIVGVVGDVHSTSLDTSTRPTIYVPYRQDPWPFMTFALRMTGTPESSSYERAAGLQTAVRDAIWRVDKDQPVGAILTMDDQLSNSLTRRRFSVTLLSLFGGVSVTLAAIGLYGVLAFIVAQRRREIGVRMALGASPRAVVVDILGQGLRLAGLGVACGLAISLAVTRVLTSLLFSTSPTDAATFAAVALLFVVIAAGASLVPAWRASRVDPLIALRDE